MLELVIQFTSWRFNALLCDKTQATLHGYVEGHIPGTYESDDEERKQCSLLSSRTNM